jgi:hypothetical protein
MSFRSRPGSRQSRPAQRSPFAPSEREAVFTCSKCPEELRIPANTPSSDWSRKWRGFAKKHGYQTCGGVVRLD